MHNTKFARKSKTLTYRSKFTLAISLIWDLNLNGFVSAI